MQYAIAQARKRGDRIEVRALRRKLRGLPTGDPRDPGYRRLRYCRYADLCGIPIWGYVTTVRDEWRGLFTTVGVSVADVQSGVVTLRL